MRRDVFQALADPTRRDIINLIAYKSLTPNGVANSFDLSRQAISKHIKILEECGLIVIDQQGRERLCHVQAAALNEVDDWLAGFRKIVESRFSRLDTLLMKMKKAKDAKEKKRNVKTKRK